MLSTAVLVFSVVVTVASLDILSVSYTFKDEFHRTFKENKCVLRCEWLLVNYDSVGVAAPNNSLKAIRADSHSCVTFPITLIPGSSLELYVFLRTVKEKSGVVVLVVDENDVPVTKYVYNKSTKGFVLGWSQISLPIVISGTGYINLIGYSEDNEIVLVDSFNYVTNISEREENGDEASLIIAYRDEEINIRTDLIDNNDIENFDNIIDNDDSRIEYVDDNLENDNEGSGDPILDPVDPVEENNAIGPWTITVISVVAVTGLGVLGVGVYHLGFNRGLAQNPPFVDVEPARAVRIPRVRGVNESPIERIGMSW